MSTLTSLSMECGMRSIYFWELNKGFFGFKFQEGYPIQRQTPEESWKVQQPKHCDYNNQDEYTSM